MKLSKVFTAVVILLATPLIAFGQNFTGGAYCYENRAEREWETYVFSNDGTFVFANDIIQESLARLTRQATWRFNAATQEIQTEATIFTGNKVELTFKIVNAHTLTQDGTIYKACKPSYRK